MSVKILDRDNPILRRVAKPVQIPDIKSVKIKKVISDMKEALHSQDDSVAIAAPQIGESLRIFIVSKRAFELAKRPSNERDDMVFINPEITKISKKKRKMEEGCLSVRWLYGQVERSEKAHVKAYNEQGELFERGSSGLLSQIFQHEIDHLDGVLFIDKAENLEDIPPKTNHE